MVTCRSCDEPSRKIDNPVCRDWLVCEVSSFLQHVRREVHVQIRFAAGNLSASSACEKSSVCTGYIIELSLAGYCVLLKCGALHACSFCRSSCFWQSLSLWSLLCTHLFLMILRDQDVNAITAAFQALIFLAYTPTARASWMKTLALPFPSRISAGSLLVRSIIVEPSDTWQPLALLSACSNQSAAHRITAGDATASQTLDHLHVMHAGHMQEGRRRGRTRKPQSTTKSRPFPANISIMTAASANSSSPSAST